MGCRMPVKLFNCKSESEQAAWAVEHLKEGGRIHEISLWLGGVDYPMQIVAKVKTILRAEGRIVTKAIETVRDVGGEDHCVLAWRLEGKASEARKTPRQAL
jgi:hypothetical protein